MLACGEDILDLCAANNGFDPFGTQLARHLALYVFDQVINDIEIFQANLVPLGQHARLCIGSNVEADERSIGCSRERHVGLSDRAHAAMQHTDLDLKSEERRVGKEWVSTCISRGTPDY